MITGVLLYKLKYVRRDPYCKSHGNFDGNDIESLSQMTVECCGSLDVQ